MREETLEFLEIAKENLSEARRALESGLVRSACFWSQQAIELFLKAFLIENNVFDIRRHRTHNLVYLARECCKLDEDFQEILKIEKLEDISGFAIIARYDVSFIARMSEDDAKQSVKIAEKVGDLVLRKLESRGGFNILPQ